MRGLSLETLICDSRCMIWEGVTMETVIPGRGPRSWGYHADCEHVTPGRGSGGGLILETVEV